MKISNLALLGAAAVAIGAASRRATAPVTKAVDKVAAAVSAASPPAPRSANIFARILHDMQEDRLLSVAAGVAFYALLGLAPTLAAAVSLFGLVADPAQVARFSTSLTHVLPAEAAKLVQDEAQRLAAQGAQALSVKLGVSLLLSLWTASAAIRSLFDALNVIDEQQETRSVFRLYATGLVVTLAGVLVFLLSLAVIGANPRFVALGALSQQSIWLYGLLRWPIFYCVATLVIAALYWLGPSRPPARFVRLLRGAAAAALLWALGSWLFSYYVETLANYSATYGSLATVAVVMTWLWLSAAIVLLGAQLNFELSPRGAREP